MNSHFLTDTDILNWLKPETDLECQLALHPYVKAGLGWGEPRYGHPEGKVLYHIPEIFININRLTPPLSKKEREYDTKPYLLDVHNAVRPNPNPP